MNMEQRKANWLARVFTIITDQVPIRSDIQRARLIVSVCQDAYNEGVKSEAKRQDNLHKCTPSNKE